MRNFSKAAWNLQLAVSHVHIMLSLPPRAPRTPSKLPCVRRGKGKDELEAWRALSPASPGDVNYPRDLFCWGQVSGIAPVMGCFYWTLTPLYGKSR
jgi:hypothetical protein